MSNKTDRAKKAMIGAYSEGIEFKGIKFRKFTVRDAILLERFNSNGQGMTGTMEFLYILSKDSKDLIYQTLDEFYLNVLDFGANFTIDEMSKLAELVKESNEVLGLSQIEVIDEHDDDGKKN